MIERKDQRIEDTWDLSLLAEDGESWEKEMRKLRKAFRKAGSYKGTLLTSPDSLYNALVYLKETSMLSERVGNWAFLSYEADSMDKDVQRRLGTYQAAAASFSEAISYFSPELMAGDEKLIREWMKEPRFREFRIWMRKTLREKKHVLSESEERIMSLFSPVSGGAEKTFMDLNNIELEFDDVEGEKLTHGTYAKFLKNPDEKIRREAYSSYYKAYDAHKHTLSDLYAASINEDIFVSKARKFRSSLEAALFPDDIPESVYTSLISSVHEAFPTLHEYYRVKAKVIGKEKLRHWDCYIPMVPGIESHHSYDEAVGLISEAVKPLGEEYRSTLVKGLTEDRWVDRYENKGKRSGAFSAGSYAGNPYILTNFEDSVLDSVFTLIHEGGHSMHSWYSVRNNPYMCYDYSIFEAEVASTFNENLLSHYLLEHASSDEEAAYIIGKNLDDIVATLFRQTMFAEFELLIHRKAENEEPITLDVMRSEYGRLQREYFGDAMEFEDVSNLECLRIPHFYRAFYCYKYATGISASIALSERVLSGGDKERDDYISFLKSGGSRTPIKALRVAGVDMASPLPVKAAAEHFGQLLERFRSLRSV